MNKQQNIENFKKLVSKTKSGLLEKLQLDSENEQWLDRSFQIILNVVRAMRKQGLKQKDLAERMGVTPQYISKILKGKENLSLQTISKLEEVLGIQLLIIPESVEPPVSFEKYTMVQGFMIQGVTESFISQMRTFKPSSTPVECLYQSSLLAFQDYQIRKKHSPSTSHQEEGEFFSVA